MSRKRSRKAYSRLVEADMSRERKVSALSGAATTFLVFHQGSQYTVHKMEDGTCHVTLGMAGFSPKPIARGTRRWKAVMRKAQSDVNRHEVETILTT